MSQVEPWQPEPEPSGDRPLVAAAPVPVPLAPPTDDLLAVLSHEIRTPLTALQSAVKMLRTGRLGTLSADGEQLLAIADQSADRLQHLVTQILDCKRLEAGQFKLVYQAQSIQHLLTTAIAMMQPLAEAQQLHISPEITDGILWADPDWVSQVVLNLLSNAIKVSPRGGTIWVKAQLQRSGPTADLLVQVQDQGPGLSPSVLAQIFTPFSTYHSDSAQPGTGLGLAICHRIISQHRGRLWAESSLGQGSTFSFTLPLLPPDADQTPLTH